MGRFGLRLLAGGMLTAVLSAQEQAPNRREFTVVAQERHYMPDRLEVSQDDLVKINFRSEDGPRTFVIDAYRIVKRAAGGETITFEFRADRSGTFPIYCYLTSEPACRVMKGALVVKGK
jgi:heme/copper-type cytochrome/quinol oxidase subunit 2